MRHTSEGFSAQIVQGYVDENLRKDKPNRKRLSLDYYIAGVPALSYFEMQVEGLMEIAASSDVEAGDLDALAEICFIGLAAYFEAFCKAELAAVNICPRLLEEFTRKRDCSFTLSELLHVAGARHHIGGVLSEHYDFGSARAVNGLFLDLLGISPFSKHEERVYSEFLNDRNLVVHHGGVYTLKYAAEKFRGSAKMQKAAPHWQSLVVGKADVLKWAKFLLEIAKKTSKATHNAVNDFVRDKKIKIGSERAKALKLL